MAGISSKALAFGEPKNKEQTFQGQRFDDELGLNWVQFKWRNHDPQIGRFIEIDPLAEKYVYNSTYAFSENKVTTHVELEGLEGSWFGLSHNVPPNISFKAAETQSKFAPSALKVGLISLAIFLQPEVGIPLAVADISGVPVTPSPQAMSGVAASETSTIINEVKSTETTVESTIGSLKDRADQIHSTLSPFTQTKTTTAVGTATTAEGNAVTLVASSEKNLRPAQRAALQSGEVAVSGTGHAEQTILNHAANNNMTVTAVAASRPICASCATAITNSGAQAASALKQQQVANDIFTKGFTTQK